MKTGKLKNRTVKGPTLGVSLEDLEKIEKLNRQKKRISVIVPCFNEEGNIQNAYEQIISVFETQLVHYECQLIFVNDGSHDATILELEAIAREDDRVEVIEFTRNFGKEIATSAGIHHCQGDACIIVDADMQYPVNKIPEFVKKWEQGAEVVIGVRDFKKTKNIVEKVGSYFFYKIMDIIGEIKVEPGALDFRLIDRIVIDQFNKFTERGRMMRALIDWLGYKRDYVLYTERPRRSGTSSYSFSKRVKLAIYTFISHSLFPLKVAAYLGIFITIFSGTLGLVALINQFIFRNADFLFFSGPFLLGLLNMFLIGIVLICLGLIAYYIGNIHTEVANRPLYIVRAKKGQRAKNASNYM